MFHCCVLFWIDPLAYDPTSKMDPSYLKHPIEATVEAGKVSGRLLESSKLVNKAALDRRFLEELRKIGTLSQIPEEQGEEKEKGGYVWGGGHH